MFFGWVTPLVVKGAKAPLTNKDLLEISPDALPATCAASLWLYWTQERARASPSLLWAMTLAFGGPFFSLGLLKVRPHGSQHPWFWRPHGPPNVCPLGHAGGTTPGGSSTGASSTLLFTLVQSHTTCLKSYAPSLSPLPPPASSAVASWQHRHFPAMALWVALQQSPSKGKQHPCTSGAGFGRPSAETLYLNPDLRPALPPCMGVKVCGCVLCKLHAHRPFLR
jgi:hypothetical protein